MEREDQEHFPEETPEAYPARAQNAPGRGGTTNPEENVREDAPTYTAEEQGIDQDRDARAGTTIVRSTRLRNNQPDRNALIARLNDPNSSLGEMVDYLAGNTGGRNSKATEHILRIVIYLRVSTEEQAKMGGEAEGYSIPYQREVCTAKVRALGGILVGEYVDAGESAKSAHRPQLQKMLSELRAKRIDYVIVHKIDRLARNRADDVEINSMIARAGAKLISVAEPVDETPAGKLLYNMMADVAQYHSDNLAVEVLKGMDTKAKKGGTPYRAPLGYLNRQDFTDGARHSYVILDPERAPLIRWAFETYALGDWPIRRIVDALNAQGLRTRSSRKLTAKPLTISGVHHMLRNPYYMGVVPYRGVYHEGKHEPLIGSELWLRVQEVLTAHHLAGEKERKHPHYLKGSIFCGECGARLIYSRNRGHGGEYEYYTCLSRRTGRRPCTRRPMRLEKIEDGIARFYGSFQLRPERASQVREGVLEELTADRDQATRESERARLRISRLQDQRKKLLAAHYAGAVPVDMLKDEMDRLTGEMAAAEASAKAAVRSLDKLEDTLSHALSVAGNCTDEYLAPNVKPAVRRMFNQGLFVALYMGQDGSVERVEMTEPFATLLDRNLLGDLAREREAGREPALSGLPVEGEKLHGDMELEAESFTFASKTDKPDGGAVRLGLHKITLVPPRGLEPPTHGLGNRCSIH
jgi:site-specific DNA recombinase